MVNVLYDGCKKYKQPAIKLHLSDNSDYFKASKRTKVLNLEQKRSDIKAILLQRPSFCQVLLAYFDDTSTCLIVNVELEV